ncbi:response regulator, partial [Patescibacteria group bacterium]
MSGSRILKDIAERHAPTSGWHVLVADDDPAGLELAGGILQHAGYVVSTARDGQEAWEFIQANSTDLIVSDLFMPRMDGMALLRAVVELPEAPSMILVTGYSSIDSAIEATKLGVYGYLIKPVCADRLRHLVGRALDERRLQQDYRRLQREVAVRYGLHQIVGQSQQIREILRLVE